MQAGKGSQEQHPSLALLPPLSGVWGMWQTGRRPAPLRPGVAPSRQQRACPAGRCRAPLHFFPRGPENCTAPHPPPHRGPTS